MPLAPLDTLLPSLLRNKSQNNCLKPQNASGIAPGEEEERQSDLGKLVKTQTTLSGFSAGEETHGHMVGLGSPHPLACGRRCSKRSPWPLGGLRSLLNPVGTCPRDQLSQAKTGVRERGPEETGLPSVMIPRHSSAGFGFSPTRLYGLLSCSLSISPCGERVGTDQKGPPVERFGLGVLPRNTSHLLNIVSTH